MKKLHFLIFFIIATSFINKNIFAESNILINEFLINSSPQQVELINTSSQSADISGWYVDDEGGKSFYTIPQGSIIYPQSCLIFSGNFYLNKSSSDTIRLFDNTVPPSSSSANLIDSYSYINSPDGSQSFSRLPDGKSWTTQEQTIGSFNTTKMNCIVTPSPTPTNTPIPIPTATLTPTYTVTPTPTVLTQQDYKNIYIWEVMVNPPVGEKEWVELFNNNSSNVSLSDWYIDDAENSGSSPHKFSIEIKPFSYGAIELPSPMFNNSKDTVRLLDSQKRKKDFMSYSSSNRNQTWGREDVNTHYFCLQTPSKNRKNNACLSTESLIPIDGNQKNNTSIKITKGYKKIKSTVVFTNQNNISHQQIDSKTIKPQILGAQTRRIRKNKILFALPFSYSVLTLINLLRKILK